MHCHNVQCKKIPNWMSSLSMAASKMHFWRLSMIKWCKLLYILRMASDHVLGCSWGHNWLIWMKFSENVHRTFQFLGCTNIELKRKKKHQVCQVHLLIQIDPCLIMIKNLELKIHIHRFYSSLCKQFYHHLHLNHHHYPIVHQQCQHQHQKNQILILKLILPLHLLH